VEEYNTKQIHQARKDTAATMTKTSGTTLKLVVEPADANTPQDNFEGNLAVLHAHKGYVLEASHKFNPNSPT
jgi:hypothetical protein